MNGDRLYIKQPFIPDGGFDFDRLTQKEKTFILAPKSISGQVEGDIPILFHNSEAIKNTFPNVEINILDDTYAQVADFFKMVSLAGNTTCVLRLKRILSSVASPPEDIILTLGKATIYGHEFKSSLMRDTAYPWGGQVNGLYEKILPNDFLTFCFEPGITLYTNIVYPTSVRLFFEFEVLDLKETRYIYDNSNGIMYNYAG